MLSVLASAAGLSAVSGRVGATERTKRVPKYLSGGEVVEWMTVPRRWHRHRDRASELLRRFNRDHLGNRPEIFTTGLTRSDRTYGDLNGFEIEVTYDANAGRPDVASEVAGLPVRQEGQKEPPAQQVCNRGDFDRYGGGINVLDYLDADVNGTAGYRVVDDNGGEYMVSAAHIFGDCGINSFDEAYQQTEGVGAIVGGAYKKDFVVFDDSAGNADIKNVIREPDGTERQIAGCASYDEISRRVSDPFDGYSKVGVGSGKEAGGIVGMDLTVDRFCESMKKTAIKGTTNAVAGDSGAPYYSVENGDAYLLGHHSVGSNISTSGFQCGENVTIRERSLGLPCYWVESETQYSITSS